MRSINHFGTSPDTAREKSAARSAHSGSDSVARHWLAARISPPHGFYIQDTVPPQSPRLLLVPVIEDKSTSIPVHSFNTSPVFRFEPLPAGRDRRRLHRPSVLPQTLTRAGKSVPRVPAGETLGTAVTFGGARRRERVPLPSLPVHAFGGM